MPILSGYDREDKLHEMLGVIVFGLSGENPGEVLATISHLGDATEALEARYAKMVRRQGPTPAVQTPAPAGAPRKRAANGSGNPRGRPRGNANTPPAEPPKQPDPPLFAGAVDAE